MFVQITDDKFPFCTLHSGNKVPGTKSKLKNVPKLKRCQIQKYSVTI